MTSTMRILLCHDVDLQSAVQVSELIVTTRKTAFDLVLISGPFTAETNTIPYSPEEEAVRIADISSIIAQLENIVCRVLYLPSEFEPLKIRSDQQYFLTPNSHNINTNYLRLNDSMGVLGILEEEDMLTPAKLPYDFDRTKDSDDELEDVVVRASPAATILEKLLTTAAQETDVKSKLLLFNYKFPSTLNQLLFHMPDLIKDIVLCVIIQAEGSDINLPAKIGNNMLLLSPKSMRREGLYYEIQLELNGSGAWNVVETNEMRLDAPTVPVKATHYI